MIRSGRTRFPRESNPLGGTLPVDDYIDPVTRRVWRAVHRGGANTLFTFSSRKSGLGQSVAPIAKQRTRMPVNGFLSVAAIGAMILWRCIAPVEAEELCSQGMSSIGTDLS